MSAILRRKALMHRRCRAVLAGALAILGFVCVGGTDAALADSESAPRAPLAFEPNHGQFDPVVRFASRGKGYTLFLTDTESVLAIGSTPPIRLTLNGRQRTESGRRRSIAGIVNYLIGRDPSRWHTRIPRFASVRYDDVYQVLTLDAVSGEA